MSRLVYLTPPFLGGLATLSQGHHYLVLAHHIRALALTSEHAGDFIALAVSEGVFPIDQEGIDHSTEVGVEDLDVVLGGGSSYLQSPSGLLVEVHEVVHSGEHLVYIELDDFHRGLLLLLHYDGVSVDLDWCGYLLLQAIELIEVVEVPLVLPQLELLLLLHSHLGQELVVALARAHVTLEQIGHCLTPPLLFLSAGLFHLLSCKLPE